MSAANTVFLLFIILVGEEMFKDISAKLDRIDTACNAVALSAIVQMELDKADP